MGVYSSSCPKVESIVRATVDSYFKKDATLAAALLRMHFHDCFVQGCDGSDLIDTPTSERKALPNLGLRGFQVIDDAKSQLEAICPGVISCADILALAARDAVDLIGGPSWGVPTGRRDGRISLSSEVSNLPSPFDTVAIQRQKFTDKGLDVLMTMILSHLLEHIRWPGQTSCVALDQNSDLSFDVNFFKNVRDGYAILESDQRLYGDSNTRRLVDNFAGAVRGLLGLRFNHGFPKSMVKMSSIEVKTGTQGEIRRFCSKINYY
ncbi:hypothetical protein ACS0TY_021364 [Phlomoides rotata]